MSIICTKLFDQFNQLYSSFNPSYFIIGVTAFNQGIQHLSDLAVNYMLKDEYGLSPAMMGLYLSYTTLPWMIKPFWGIITDSKPFLGYRRKSYIILFGILDALGWIMMSKNKDGSLVSVLLLLFLIQLSICFVNVVGEAILVEVAAQASREQRQNNFQHGASRNVSIFFGVRAVGSLLSAYSSGALLHYFTYQQIFMITSIFPMILVFVSFFYQEQKIDVNSLDQNDRKNNTTQCLKDFWQFFKNPLIYKPVMLIFAFMMAPSSSTIMFFFYTEVLGFNPKFLGQLKFMYAVASISGVLIYNNYLRDIQFRKIFLVTTFLYYLCYQSIIILVTRKNVEWGINDKIFCIGDQVMLQFVGELNIMPVLVLACRMCPKHIEATMYAMLMSTINFGSMLGSWLGALFLIWMKIDQTDYSRLWLFIAITGVFILLPLPWLYVVREDEILKQREKPLEEEEKKEVQSSTPSTSKRDEVEEKVPLLQNEDNPNQ
ncbi:unnamed protein product (macronuclear) [Paramecium tetraurelia]|uniref:Major facilitator superfamily (MFS) profile domain-containing protein n=1 Tax=Paramecium tetraurelia TaxID=5888 RepID=A0D0X1_PARTE|nr:uncharacterized protein GSPATT00012240001 [Paramecium tetraurelia]CAK76688.1 unnamed protein product [Paramecium tetraurelia]|eukprot:XP_001444085.1 hypothetical protein (macronuclear) [Paramecium tetraurelia strain d4-2]